MTEGTWRTVHVRESTRMTRTHVWSEASAETAAGVGLEALAAGAWLPESGLTVRRVGDVCVLRSNCSTWLRTQLCCSCRESRRESTNDNNRDGTEIENNHPSYFQSIQNVLVMS